jgi:hypothetical protein
MSILRSYGRLSTVMPGLAFFLSISSAALASNAPTITSLVPNMATAGGAAFTLTVNGTNFTSTGTVVKWKGTALSTTYKSATQVTVKVTSAMIVLAGTAAVTMATPTGTSNAVTFTIKPAAPANLTATAGNAQVSLNWTAAAGSASYAVLRSTTSGSSYATIATGVSTTNYVDKKALNGISYFYIVQSVNGSLKSSYSNQASARPSGILQSRIMANQSSFTVYADQDHPLNHGYPSGYWGNTKTVTLEAGCIDDPSDPVTGCYPASNTSALDKNRGTVLRITFAAQPSYSSAGVNFEEPEDWAVRSANHEPGMKGYDLSGANSVVFDARSPDGAEVQFGVGECTAPFSGPLQPTWTTITIPFSSLNCTLDLKNVNVLFGVATNDIHAPKGATVLLDNIHFAPVPTQVRSGTVPSLPLSTRTFGVVPKISDPIPPDQANRNIAATYEEALIMRVLIGQGDVANAARVGNGLDYALFHDNHGVYISITPQSRSACFSGVRAGQCGLHNAYEAGDLAFLNKQATQTGKALAGDARLAGFTCGSLSANGYCLVLDGATGGNNAWAILALLELYQHTGNVIYLNDAKAIGRWVIANLADTGGKGFGGYFVGYLDQGAPSPKPLNYGKSTENNADIFTAFMELSKYDASNATMWTNAANAAGDFVMAMYEPSKGRFNTGTVQAGTKPEVGVCPAGATRGNDTINAESDGNFNCDFLDADTFTTLAMAGSSRYSRFKLPDGEIMDWNRPVQYALSTFAQTIEVGGHTFNGFDIVVKPVSGTNGVAWEFTGQMVEAMRYVDRTYHQNTFESQADFYLGQIQAAQASAPFGDGQGLVASILENGDTLPPGQQCLDTPFQNCPPERVGLAATGWMMLAEEQVNPLATW